MSVDVYEDKDENGNVIARSIEISMPPGYKNIRTYHKPDYKPLTCNECGREICMFDEVEVYGDFRCFNCFNSKPEDTWEEEH